MSSDPRVSVIRLTGVIAAGNKSGALNDASMAPVIERAFTKGKPKAVALVINSPGGSPVQSSLIAARIRRLAAEHDVPVHAFVEDVAASGGYWLACAADHIWLDASSITGSIGVISASFGFDKLMAHHGIDRRVHTAGKDKSMLDPFRPERDEDITRLKQLQLQIHESFIAHVTARREGRLSGDKDLFTGEIWVGQGAVDVGLADGLAHVQPKMKDMFGDKTRFAVYGPRKGLMQRIGASVIGDAIGHVEDRALWAQFGL